MLRKRYIQFPGESIRFFQEEHEKIPVEFIKIRESNAHLAGRIFKGAGRWESTPVLSIKIAGRSLKTENRLQTDN
ncbi:MAG TPA: hypothetical protein DDX98_12790 [Bacteroidales bacterium]|nr:hypothetical protein [Bacteroidales bacterium]